MKKKIFVICVALIVLISGGVYCMTKWIEHQNSPYNVSDVLDDKGVKLYKLASWRPCLRRSATT